MDSVDYSTNNKDYIISFYQTPILIILESYGDDVTDPAHNEIQIHVAMNGYSK